MLAGSSFIILGLPFAARAQQVSWVFSPPPTFLLLLSVLLQQSLLLFFLVWLMASRVDMIYHCLCWLLYWRKIFWLSLGPIRYTASHLLSPSHDVHSLYHQPILWTYLQLLCIWCWWSTVSATFQFLAFYLESNWLQMGSHQQNSKTPWYWDIHIMEYDNSSHLCRTLLSSFHFGDLEETKKLHSHKEEGTHHIHGTRSDTLLASLLLLKHILIPEF